ncbi:hypothetical protein [Chryseobacterium sp.]|uniref:hypothetical protein n=1 Tax=Chryseobacterium sp. TaxID=1871047 RepID=UPI00289D6FD2|nr:hypothetical protein [Chryseobacterium sp.]
MEIPNKVNIRIVFKLGNEDLYTKFYWFKMDNNELYWGSPKKNKLHHYDVKPENNKVEIIIPENINDLPLVESKISYHNSGEVHIKNISEDGIVSYEGVNKWLVKEDILRPVNILTVISAVIDQHKEKIANPDKKRNYSIRFPIPEEYLKKRFYMECYLCPEGKYDFPEPLLKVDIPKENITTMSLSKQIILVIRFTIIDSLKDWHPDTEISFLPIDLK